MDMTTDTSFREEAGVKQIVRKSEVACIWRGGVICVSVKTKAKEKKIEENDVQKVNISIQTKDVSEFGGSFMYILWVSARRWIRTVIHSICKARLWWDNRQPKPWNMKWKITWGLNGLGCGREPGDRELSFTTDCAKDALGCWKQSGLCLFGYYLPSTNTANCDSTP